MKIGIRGRTPRLWRKAATAALTLGIVAQSLVGASLTSAHANAFTNTWARTDQLVADQTVSRTWMWGPLETAWGRSEAYTESPGGEREVLYFDKSRMEISDPTGNPTDDWYVTNGLLVVELMTGQMQMGDGDFDGFAAADINVAGDANDPDSPTYADLAPLRSAPARAADSMIVQVLNGDGTVSTDNDFADYDVTSAERVTVPGIDHQVASVFWTFMNSSGPVLEGGEQVNDQLFSSPFYATGYPLTEAYWTTVDLAGEPTDVLLQCFERRCLTYTPGNDAGWQVEAGNVGQHYFRWRYGHEIPGATTLDVSVISLDDGGDVGCNDSLETIERPSYAYDGIEEQITAALDALLTLDGPFIGESGLYNALATSSLEVNTVAVVGDHATVDLSGSLATGGICDEPRMEAQLTQSVLAQGGGVTQVTITLNGAPLFASEQVAATVYAISLNDGGPVGCEDSLAALEVMVPTWVGTEAGITAALTALLNLGGPTVTDEGLANALWASDASVQSVTIDDEGHATVALTGEIPLGGVCDAPRVEAQLSATVLEFDEVTDVTFMLNGTEWPVPQG